MTDISDFSTELITKDHLIRAFYSGGQKEKFQAVSAGYNFAAEFPDRYPFAELLAKCRTKDAAIQYASMIQVDPEDAQAKEKNAAKDAIVELFREKGTLNVDDIYFCFQLGVQLRLRPERAFNIITEMLTMLSDSRDTDPATGWAAVRCLNLVANLFARGKTVSPTFNEHNLSNLCDKLMGACTPMRSWRFREHAISLVGALGTYSHGGVIVPLVRLRGIMKNAKDSPTWSRAAVCIAHQICNEPAGDAATEYVLVLIGALNARRERFRPFRQKDMEQVYSQAGIALGKVLEHHKEAPQFASQLIPVVIRLFLDAELRGRRFASAVEPLIGALDYAVAVEGVRVGRRTLRMAKELDKKLMTAAKPSFDLELVLRFDDSLIKLLHAQKAQRGAQDVLGEASVDLRRRGARGSALAGRTGTLPVR